VILTALTVVCVAVLVVTGCHDSGLYEPADGDLVMLADAPPGSWTIEDCALAMPDVR
jgi:hypothetical protein